MKTGGSGESPLFPDPPYSGLGGGEGQAGRGQEFPAPSRPIYIFHRELKPNQC